MPKRTATSKPHPVKKNSSAHAKWLAGKKLRNEHGGSYPRNLDKIKL